MPGKDTSDEYNVVHSYFIGPKGANMPDFRANINTILDEVLEARLNYWPEDNNDRFISTDVRRSEKFLQARDNLRHAVQKAAQLLGEHSVPFWSPRYQAHMCMDLTMPSLLGYFMTMLYNPNNVALEASPLTTLVELRVGKQLCDLFGYNSEEPKPTNGVSDFSTDVPKVPVGWGHITCDGTVANLESIWVARNLKFYPISLSRAVKEGKLKFIKEQFKVKPCKKGSSEKLFSELSPWELLNLRPETVLDIPEKLYAQFGISSEFLEDALKEYNIQTIGREPLEKDIVKKPMQYFISNTRHYSWPKGAAIAGLGSGNVTGIDVDNDAHIDLKLLEEKLKECADKEETAVYAVVAVIGSTEEGAVDRLSQMLKLREKFQDEYGLSFLVHADAAWGGYFATMLRRTERGPVRTDPRYGDSKNIVPALVLKKETEEDLLALKHADSITVDPHKAGYIPYPAGSLVYRDGRMRHLVTWSSPYLSQGSADNIGVYGVEGSKPGAAAMSTWFSNQTLGLNPDGYGTLLGEAAFTSARLSAYYATMKSDCFVCVPFNRLSSEKDKEIFVTSAVVQQERDWIQENILDKNNEDIMESPEVMAKLRELGSDLNINAFTLNWLDSNGKLNTDVEEANYLMKRVVDRMSITSADTDPAKISMFLTSTKFKPEEYGKCAQRFMERMGLTKCEQDLFVIRNVVMNPFPTQMNFLGRFMANFKEIVEEEVENVRKRNSRKRYLQFQVQGEGPEVFLVLQTSFHSATLRQQLILTATLDGKLADIYDKLKNNSEETIIILDSTEQLDMEAIDKKLKEGSKPKVSGKLRAEDSKQGMGPGNVTFASVVKSRPLNSKNRDTSYPAEFMPFYLYGPETEMLISHILVRAPNIALSASGVTFSPPLDQAVLELLPKGAILALQDLPEASMQPFPIKKNPVSENFFFEGGKTFNVLVWKDPNEDAWKPGPGLLKGLDKDNALYRGEMTLGKRVQVDAVGPNKDQFSRVTVDSGSWQKELDKIGNMLSRSS